MTQHKAKKTKRYNRYKGWRIVPYIAPLIFIFIAANIAVILSNQFHDIKKYGVMQDPTQASRVLVIAPHPDDETIIAGGYMIKTSEVHGYVYTMVITDGAYRKENMTAQDIRDITLTRQKESMNALSLMGIPETDIMFLGIEDQKGLLDQDNLNRTIQAIAEIIKEQDPDIIFIPAYEGGHCDHDLTNFAVATAIRRYDLARSGMKVYEGAEYNNYRNIIDYIIKVSSYISLVKPERYPRFVNNKDEEVYRLNMTGSEIALKRSVLESYKSQSMDILIEYHAGEDLYRMLPRYDYSSPPYRYDRTMRYYACTFMNIFRKDHDCSAYNLCNVPFAQMKELVGKF